MKKYHYENVSLLITIYNRSASLERLLKAFDNLECSFGEIIVSDDGSKDIHLDKVKALQQHHSFKLITSPENRGLGNNINKGQAAVSKPYTLYVQEDFVPKKAFLLHFSDSIDLMEKYPDMDIARYYAYHKYPYTRPLEKDFVNMIFKWWYVGYLKFHYYSDHPHLRRSNFLEKFGKYKEGVNVNISEYTMTIIFLKYGGKGFIYKDVYDLFDQINDAVEPSTASYRKDWRNGKSWPIVLLRRIFLQYKVIKCYFDLIFLTKN